jgi:GT2 family glycosyltransferase
VPASSEDTNSPMRPRVTVLVPNFNGRELLEIVIPSLLAQSYRDRAIVIIDDGSTDGSDVYAAARWPAVEVLSSTVNRGFAAAANRGLASASSEYVAIVNSDVELAPDWLELLVDTLDRYPGAASATGKTMRYSERDRIDGAGNQMRWSGAATRRGYGELDRGQYDEPSEVISACAGFALYRRSALDVVGDFDEDLIAYYEDVDWGLRAQLAGFGCRYEPRAVAYHIGGATHGDDARYDCLSRRNQLLVVIKDYPAAAIARHWPKLLVGQLILLARAARDGHLDRQLRAIAAALSVAKSTRDKRGAVKRTSHVGIERLEVLMAPERYELAVSAARARASGLRSSTARIRGDRRWRP